MSKNRFKARKHESGRTITTKTPYGITSDMVVNDADILSKVSIPEGSVLVKDDDGYFFVSKDRVDDGLACPVRYSENYRDNMRLYFEGVLNDAR
jgi:hypothetical protein